MKDYINDEYIFNNYFISEDGVVSSKITGNTIKHQITEKGYHCVHISKSGLQRRIRVHRFVALKYLPNPLGLPQINHKDGDKDNNHFSNLEWCNDTHNRDHGRALGLYHYGEKHKGAYLKDDDVITIRNRISNGEVWKVVHKDYMDRIGWYSFREICRGKSWKHLLCI